MEFNIHVFYDHIDTRPVQFKKTMWKKRWIILGNKYVFTKY